MKRKNQIGFNCDKCGKPLPRNEEKSSASWSVYDSKQKCTCGGKFVMCFDGKPVTEANND